MKLGLSQLHQLVWSVKPRVIAEFLKVSTSNLQKTCKRHGVTRPQFAYWAQSEAARLKLYQNAPRPEADYAVILGAAVNLEGTFESFLEQLRQADGTEGTKDSPQLQTPAPSSPQLRPRASEPLCPSAGEGAQNPWEPADLQVIKASGALSVLVEQYNWCNSASAVIRRVEEVALQQSAPIEQALQLWLATARQQLAARDPIEGLLRACRQLFDAFPPLGGDVFKGPP